MDRLKITFLFILLFALNQLFAQFDTLRVMTYNVLNFPLSSSGREVYFQTVNQYLNADVVLVNEISNSSGASTLLDDGLNVDGIDYYEKAEFVLDSSLSSCLYYNSDKLTLYLQSEIEASPRDINEYILYYNSDDLANTNDTIFFYFYLTHLKASQGEDNENQRLFAVDSFLEYLNGIPNPENIFFCGDLNLYTSAELAYQALINNTPIDFNDPLDAGSWHDAPSFSNIHTQSTRTISFGDGATGGLDDRFDFILFSDDVLNGNSRVEYIDGSCEAFGNDGNHYNDSLTATPINPNIPDSVTNALYYMSDHLPVIADFLIEAEIDTTMAELVITEIMYNPPGADTIEFIEIYNNGSSMENLSGYSLSSAVEYVFPVFDLDVGEYVLISNDSLVMLNAFGVEAFEWSSGALSNSGELIVLKNNLDEIIDEVDYDEELPWPTEPDGTGPSLILCDVNTDNSLGTNWTYSQNYVVDNGAGAPIYATPGFTECGFPPVAEFSANLTEINTGDNIQFSDLSTNSPTSWYWTFEGGTPSTSTDQNPNIIYNGSGIFNVSLSVSNDGGSDEILKEDYITVFEPLSGVLMITEIMQNPSSGIDDSDGEWFEVFNPTNSPVNMENWTVMDDGSDDFIVSESLIVQPKGFVVLGNNINVSSNGNYTCDYEFDGMFLGNGWDELILLNPSLEEIDRIEYDDGDLWPDPNGKSMVFTGTINDDNNDPAFWEPASLRELSYVGSSGDLGSPGTQGINQNLVLPDFILDLKVFMEGPFFETSMNDDLIGLQDFPMDQPYSGTPWNYSETESITEIPTGVVDWILVEIRDADLAENATSSTEIARKAAFLLNDGTVTDLDGESNLIFEHEINDELFIVVWHRNHLPILSSNPATKNGDIYSYDFTLSQSAAYNSKQNQVNTNEWGMIAGDCDASEVIDLLDKTLSWDAVTGSSGYLKGDINLDTQVNNTDKNDFWTPNFNAESSIPD